jgi:hypothetical protein
MPYITSTRTECSGSKIKTRPTVVDGSVWRILIINTRSLFWFPVVLKDPKSSFINILCIWPVTLAWWWSGIYKHHKTPYSISTLYPRHVLMNPFLSWNFGCVISWATSTLVNNFYVARRIRHSFVRAALNVCVCVYGRAMVFLRRNINLRRNIILVHLCFSISKIIINSN